MRIYLVTDEGLLLGKDLYRTVEAAVKGFETKDESLIDQIEQISNDIMEL